MARAKRTDRAEARRQYRAFLQAQAEAQAAAAAAAANPEEEAPAPTPTRGLFGRRQVSAPARPAPAAAGAREVRSRPAAAAASAGAPQTGPMSFFKAMGVAYHQIHYRDDLRYLPTLLTKSYAVWIGVGLSVMGMTVMLVDNDPKDFWFGIAQVMIAPYPLVPVMLVGIAAPRAAWLAGLICGAVAGLCTSVVIFEVAPKLQLLNGVSDADKLNVALTYVVVGSCFGAVVAALSAWYRRFLSLVMVPKGGARKPAARSSSAAKRPVKKSPARR